MTARGNPNRSVIYCVTCTPTGKKYIGLTISGIKIRWQSHCRRAKATLSAALKIAMTAERKALLSHLAKNRSKDVIQKHADRLRAISAKRIGTSPSAETRMKMSVAQRARNAKVRAESTGEYHGRA